MIATKQDLEYCLRRWGREFGEAPPSQDEDDVDAVLRVPVIDNPIAELREFAAPRVASAAEVARHRRLYGRSHARLLSVGKNAGLQRKAHGVTAPADAAAPAWAVDPIRAPRSYSGGGTLAFRDPIAEAVERAAMQLHRFDKVMGVCLRVEYCVFGRFREKVARAGYYLELNLPSREYRRGVDRGKVWMWGKLS